jgi:hypothetical protein
MVCAIGPGPGLSRLQPRVFRRSLPGYSPCGMEASRDRAAEEGRPQREDLSVAHMVVANRPWRLVGDLSKVLVATLATAGFFIINSNAWSISDQLETLRLLVVAVAALSGLGVWLVVAHSLWERPSQSDNPTLTKRVNAATAVTLFLGLVFGYCVLYLVVLAATALVVPDGYMAQNLGHDAGFEDYVAAAWLTSSLATVAGAIGSGLESDDEVRETVSRYRPVPEEPTEPSRKRLTVT